MLISVILGLMISAILSKLWLSHNIVYRAPDSAKIRKNIYQKDSKNNCIQLIPQPVIGPIIYRNEKENLDK